MTSALTLSSPAADLITVGRDSEGNPCIDPDFKGEKTHDFIVKMANAFNHTNDWYTSNNTKVRNIFAENRALFITDRAFIAETVLRNADVSYGIMPQPKYDETRKITSPVWGTPTHSTPSHMTAKPPIGPLL